ncbi:hypothetical protein [Planctomicrobium sp. SH664]|uniref:hypothetical protein n=1 Tax=Planctomicrobium sp. SH664 TaxID=3448125 RepID=UPI003F5CB862
MSFWEALWLEPWWRYDPATAGGWGKLYHGFNLFEGGVWLLLGGLVLLRGRANRKSRLELAYAGLLWVFALTDFREAFEQSAPLVLVKGLVLMLLWSLRRCVTATCDAGRTWW